MTPTFNQLLISRAANGFVVLAVPDKKGETETHVAADIDEAMVISRTLLEAHENTTLRNPSGNTPPWRSDSGPPYFS